MDNLQIAREMLPVTDFYAKEKGSSLKGNVVLHINHSLDDIFLLNEILISQGAKLYFVGVPYRNLTQNLDQFSYPFITAKRKLATYHVQYNGFIEEGSVVPQNDDLVPMVVSLIKHVLYKMIIPNLKPTQKLIVIEDGGYTTYFRSELEKLSEYVGVVEQTQSGALLNEKISNKTKPVITIARSKIKKNYESHFIGQRVFEESNQLFYSIGEFLRFRSVVLAGYGVVGRQLSNSLRSNMSRVVVMDSNPVVKKLALWEGFTTTKRLSKELINDVFAYFGCTGSRSFDLNCLGEFLDSEQPILYLISGSSKRIEFLDIIDYFEQHKINDPEKYPFLGKISSYEIVKHPIGLEYKIDYSGKFKSLVLVAEGVPVNFYRKDSESVPKKAIDPINALLILSADYLLTKTGLEGKVYYVGSKSCPEFGNNEEDIIKKWVEYNHIDLPHENLLENFFGGHPAQPTND